MAANANLFARLGTKLLKDMSPIYVLKCMVFREFKK